MKQFSLLALALLLLAGPIFSQQLVKGFVLNEANEPLIGANIQWSNSGLGTVTDVDGSFRLPLAERADSLVVSYVGYQTQRLSYPLENTDILLQEDVAALDEVMVVGFAGTIGRARRRAESVQEIPESVVTLTSDQIEQRGLNNVQSFATMVPNFSFQTAQNVGVNFINIRGISQIRNGESPVAFVIDGVNIPDPNLVNQELYDLAMIEVVKGPQGTLYGKNAIGGAINILTLAPTNHFLNKATLGYGNGNSWKAQLSSSGPLLKDKIYYRVSGSYRSSDGLIENETLNETVDFLEDLTFRGQLKFDLSDRFSATAALQYTDTEGGATYYAHSPTGLQLDADDFDYIIDADQRGTSTLNNTFAFLKLEYNLGGSVLRSVTSINQADRNHRGDLDFLAADILRQIQDSNSESFNQEIRLSSARSDDRLSWDLGAFYQSSDKDLVTTATADLGFFAMPPAPTGEQSVFAQFSDFTNQFNTIALFGFVDYRLNENWTASLGLRFDHDDISQDNRLLESRPEKSQSELQPKISLSYKASDDLMIYGNYGHGYRSGGFNSDATALFDAEYDGETSNNYELGIKSSSGDKRFIANLAAFYVDFNNQQQYAVSVGSGGLVLGNYNLPETTIFGFEAELKYRPLRYLDILAGFGYNQSEIKDGGMAGTLDRSAFVGNTTPFVPRTTANLALQSAFDIHSGLAFSGFLNLSNKGRIYWHEDNIDASDPFTLLDGRLALTFDKQYQFALWGQNLLNTDYYQEYFAGEVSGSAAGDIAWIGRPLAFGAEISVRF